MKINTGIIHTGTITDKRIPEASGIAVSRINEDILWIINDSGNSADVFGVNDDGEHLVTIHVQGVKNIDWEDTASFEDGGDAYLLIADVGDNRAKRSEYYLHIIREPDLKGRPDISSISIKPSRSLTFTYEDGPRDCEAVAVDIVDKKIFLMSKRDRPPVLYELPLTGKNNLVAKRLGEIKAFPNPTADDGRMTPYSDNELRPTAMDISEDGLSVIVLTYVNAYYYNWEKHSDWLSLFLKSPEEIRLPSLQQAESVCFGKGAANIYVTTEKLPAPLLKVDLSKAGGPAKTDLENNNSALYVLLLQLMMEVVTISQFP